MLYRIIGVELRKTECAVASGTAGLVKETKSTFWSKSTVNGQSQLLTGQWSMMTWQVGPRTLERTVLKNISKTEDQTESFKTLGTKPSLIETSGGQSVISGLLGRIWVTGRIRVTGRVTGHLLHPDC